MFVYVCVPAQSPCHLNTPLANWLAPFESVLFSEFIGFPSWASAQGGRARRGVYCQECVVALKLIYRTDCATLLQGIILSFGTRLTWIISRWFDTAALGSNRLLYHASFYLTGSESRHCCILFWWRKIVLLQETRLQCQIQQRWAKTEWWQKSTRG